MRLGLLILVSLLVVGSPASASRPPDFVKRARTAVRKQESRTRQEYVSGMKRAASKLFGAATTGELAPGALVAPGGKRLVLVRKSWLGNWAAVDAKGELHEVKVQDGAITSAVHVPWRNAHGLMHEHGAYHRRDMLWIVEGAAGITGEAASYGKVTNTEVSRMNAGFRLRRRVALGRTLPGLLGVAPAELAAMTDVEVARIENALGFARLSSASGRGGEAFYFDDATPGRVRASSDFVEPSQVGSGRMPDVVYHVTAQGTIEKHVTSYARFLTGGGGAPYYRMSEPDVAMSALPRGVASSIHTWITAVREGR